MDQKQFHDSLSEEQLLELQQIADRVLMGGEADRLEEVKEELPAELRYQPQMGSNALVKADISTITSKVRSKAQLYRLLKEDGKIPRLTQSH